MSQAGNSELIGSPMSKELIDEKIKRCYRQRRVDKVLTCVSAVVTTTIFILIYRHNYVMLAFFLLVGWLVNLAVMFYCQRVWSLRINRWEALWKWCDLLEHVTLLGESGPFRAGSEGITAEILRRLPTSS